MARRSNNGIWIALVLLAVLIGLFVATRESDVSEGVQRISFPSLAKDDVTSVELTGPKVATLKKVQGEWKVLDPAHPDTLYPTESAQVDAVLSPLTSLRAPDFVTARPEKHAEFEVDAATGERVKALTSSGTLLDVVVGKAASRGGAYVRKPDQNDVYMTPAALTWAVKKSVTDLRRKNVVSVPAGELKEVTFHPAGGEPFTLARAEGTKPWELIAGKPSAPGFRFDTETAARTVQSLADLRAQDFLNAGSVPDAKLGLAGPHATVNVKTASGTQLELQVGSLPPKDDTRFASLLRSQLDVLDTDHDHQLSQSELEAASAKDGAAKEAATALVKDPQRFARFDSGAWAFRPADQLLSADDLDAVTRTGSLLSVRVSGSADIFLVPVWSAEPLTHDVLALRDLALLSFEVPHVDRVKVTTAGKTSVALTRADNAWKVEEPKSWPGKSPFDSARVATRLSEFRRWRALRVAEGVSEAQAGLSAPTLSLRVAVAGGAAQELKLGKAVPGKSPPEHYAKGAVDNLIYVVGDGLRTTLAQGAALFEKPPAPPRGMGDGLENLPPELRRQLEAMRARGGP